MEAVRNWLIANDEKVRVCVNNGIMQSNFLKPYQDINSFVVLDISPGALIEYNSSDFNVIIGACFNSIHHTLEIPLKSIVGIYMPAEENGHSAIHILPTEEDFKFSNKNIAIDRNPTLVTTKATDSGILKIVGGKQSNDTTKVVDIFSRKPINGE